VDNDPVVFTHTNALVHSYDGIAAALGAGESGRQVRP
jgi:hypothetical protein